jgi:hypothetical protein
VGGQKGAEQSKVPTLYKNGNSSKVMQKLCKSEVKVDIRVVHASPIQPQLVLQLSLNFDLNSQDFNFPNRKLSRVEVKVEAF